MERVIFIGRLFGGDTNGGSNEVHYSCDPNDSFNRSFACRFRAEYKLPGHHIETGCEFQKDDTTAAPTRAKKQHMASYKNKHHSKRMKSPTTGSGSSSNPAASTTHEDATPKSK
jgi:hypothetical protein